MLGLEDRLTIPASGVPDSDFEVEPGTELCPGVVFVSVVDSSIGEGIVNAIEVSDDAVCPVGSEVSPDVDPGVRTACVLDVVMTDPAESVVVNATTMADDETLPVKTWAIEVLDVVSTDPAEFVVVYSMTVADGDCSKLEGDAVEVREVVMTDPAGLVVVKRTTVADGESTEREGSDVVDMVETDPFNSVVLNETTDGEMVEPGKRTVLDVVTIDPAGFVVVNTITLGDGESTEIGGTDVVDTVKVPIIDLLESVVLKATVAGEIVELGIKKVP